LPSAPSFLIFHVHFQGKIELAFGFGFLDEKGCKKSRKMIGFPPPYKPLEWQTTGLLGFVDGYDKFIQYQ
jgi:hypothetical protein